MSVEGQKFKIGVDLGGTNIAVGLVDAHHRIVYKHSNPTKAKRPVDEVVNDICKTIDEVLEIAGTNIAACSSIGLGAPGICDRGNETVVRSYSLAWESVRLGELMRRRYPIDFCLDNDANCAALAEVSAGAARGKQTVVLVTLGTGIGTGIVLDGRLYSGYKGSGTEMGHMLLVLDGQMCSCGRRGCWDAYASASALVAQARHAAFVRQESLLNLFDPLTPKDIFFAAYQGDVTAAVVVDEYCRYVAAGVSNITNALAPEVILFGGGISGEGERLLKPVREYLKAHCFDKREEALPHLGIASLGNDAGIIGAAALIPWE